MDFNGDGNIDLLAAGFIGYSYIFYGNNDNSFNASELILDKNGNKIHFGIYWVDKWIYTTEQVILKFPNISGEEMEEYLKLEDVCIITKAIDWDNDGDMDLVLSGRNIGAKLCINEGSKTNPVFNPEFISVISTKGHHAEAMIDWDGDGLFDILTGSKDGGAYFYKNYGK